MEILWKGDTVRKNEGAVLLVGAELSKETHLQLELQGRGFETEAASRGDEGLTRALSRPFSVVASDLRAPRLSGLELLSRLHQDKPNLPVILTTSSLTPAAAIEASKLGAFAYIPKPFEIPRFVEIVVKAALVTRINPIAESERESRAGVYEFVGTSALMHQLYDQIGRAARFPGTVLIRGSTGTGKELVARAIHCYSQRSKGPFVDVNCSAVPETLFESDLFGHEAGAFTGARARHKGRFEQAHQGTLFLDEIGDLKPPMQVKLLRALEQKQVRRIGSSANVNTDVRVVAATNQDLEGRIETKEFRPDLFYRLGVFTIWTPDLRAHTEDILLLANAFLRRFALQMRLPAPRLDADALQYLQAQPWPGNVRQLQNVLQYALANARNASITLADVTQANRQPRPNSGCSHPTSTSYTELLQKAMAGQVNNVLHIAIKQTEYSVIKEAIALTHGNQAQAAKCLHMGRATLRDKLKKFGLFPPPKGPNHVDP